MEIRNNRGIPAALAAAVLFGASAPAAKLLLGPVSPWLLAGLFYFGSGLGLALYRIVKGTRSARLTKIEILWLTAAVITGGMIAPVLLMWGLSRMPASGASLLLNTEGVLTALLAWFAFRENFDWRIALGMALIALGAMLLSWPEDAHFGSMLPSLAIVGACFFWAMDNNLTRNVSLTDATFIAMVKGLVAGSANIMIALLLGISLPPFHLLAIAGIVGFFSYGISLVLFVIALRQLGAARTAAYFSIAPFIGALLAIHLFREPITVNFLVAGLLMAAGVWLHLVERHEHEHTHEELEHEHEHVHDEHHQHTHDESIPSTTPHTHRHRHEPLTHTHPHYPDSHHRHVHRRGLSFWLTKYISRLRK